MGHVIGIDTTYTGNPVSFNAAHGGTMKSVSVPFSPTQDLHGYANPWPGGGGVNKFDGLWQDVSSGNSYSINYIPITENTEYYICTPHIENDYVYIEWYDEDKTLLSQTYVRNGKKTSPVGAKFARLKCWHTFDVTEIAFNYPSTVTTYSPYSNICPISGMTGLSVYRTGKNLCSVNELPANPTYYWGSNYSSIVNILNTLPTGTYTMYVTQEVVTMPSSGKVAHGRPYLTALKNGTQTPVLSYSVANDDSPYVGKTYRDGGTFTITEEIKGNFNNAYFYCDQRDTHSGNGRGTYNVKEIQIELGSTATSYEPYNGNTYAIDWSAQAGTVYGGTLDVVAGVLTVDRAMVDMGERNYTKGQRNTDNTGYVFYFRDTSFKNRGELISSQFKEVYNIPNWEALPVNCCNSAAGSYIVVCADYSDAATFKAAMNGVQLVYKLATPVTYQLTPKQIAALIGQNYIWSSNNETLNTVLTAPATGFAGWLIKCVTNGTAVEIPLKYMRAETYTVTPDQRMEWSAERDVTGVLHRETVQNLPPKIEFNTPLMTNSDINALNSIIKAAFTNYLQRNITIQFYDPERNEYWEWDCYMPDVKYHIRNADTVNNIINYEELRYAFIGY